MNGLWSSADKWAVSSFFHLTHANEGDLTAVLLTGNAAFDAEIWRRIFNRLTLTLFSNLEKWLILYFQLEIFSSVVKVSALGTVLSKGKKIIELSTRISFIGLRRQCITLAPVTWPTNLVVFAHKHVKVVSQQGEGQLQFAKINSLHFIIDTWLWELKWFGTSTHFHFNEPISGKCAINRFRDYRFQNWP